MRSYCSTRDIVPNPCDGEAALQRFNHQDLDSLTVSQIVAESTVVTNELATLIFAGMKPRLIAFNTDVTDQDWLRARLAKLKTEVARRGKESR